MHAELRDVCSGLRAHAAMLAAPLAAAAGWQLASAGASGAAAATGFAATVKGVLASAKAQVALVASSATVVGVLGIVAGPWGSGDGSTAALDDLDGKRGMELVITGAPSSDESTPESIALTTGTLSTAAVVPRRRVPGGGTAKSGTAAAMGPRAVHAADSYDENARVVYRETTVDQRTEDHGDYLVLYETTSVTEINSADQTKTYTQATQYTKPDSAPGAFSSGDPRSESPTTESTTQPESVRPTSSSTTPSVTTTKTAKPPASAHRR